KSGNPVKQFSLMLENRIGAMHSIIKLLGDSNVLVLGLSVQDSFDVNVLRLVVSDPELTETLFMEKGIPFVVNEIVVVRLTEGVPSLASCLSALSAAETHIHTSYPLFINKNGWPLIALIVEDSDFAASALQKRGFKIVFQTDLSR
ncbi:MAG: acetolactate synthase, partial [Verrucomicrobiaceae bacterium]|nr:acetolactate synthase [Verrucomicrobiaceae bacterium]